MMRSAKTSTIMRAQVARARARISPATVTDRRVASGTATGIGIGLYVSRRLVEAMGGRIWAIPRVGGGSEFGFALPEWPMEPEIDEPTAVSAGEAVT